MKAHPTLAVTMGDPAGVGPELLLELSDNLAQRLGCNLRVIGDPALLRVISSGRFSAPAPGLESGSARCGVSIECPHALNLTTHAFGRPTPETGKAAYAYLERAIELARRGDVAGIVTLPLSKEALHMAGYLYPGHTEILAEKTGTTAFALMLYSERLRIVHATAHLSVRQALASLTEERVLEVIELGHGMMKRLLDYPPRIAVAGLNPHASEEGLFGDEEARIIRPAMDAAIRRGIPVEGPYPPDTVFAMAMGGRFDLVVAMLHDHGHVAFKTALFRLGDKRRTQGVNVMLGLPFVRTSVDHGTAYDIAGQGKADPGSLFDALELAARLCRSSNHS